MIHLRAVRAALRRKRRLASSAVAVAALASSVLLAGGIAASAASVAAAAPTVNLLNGGFEDPDVRGCTEVNQGSTTMKPWEITAGSVHLSGPNCGSPAFTWKSHGGDQSLDLDGPAGRGPGAISQTISTVKGNAYRVVFWVSGNNYDGDRVKTFTVDSGGEAKAYSFDTGGPTGPEATMPDYRNMTYEFTASGSSTTLTFTSTTSGSGVGFGAVLDDVTVTDVTCDTVGNGGFETPETATIQQVGEDDSSMAPWQVTSGNVHVTSTGDYSAIGGGSGSRTLVTSRSTWTAVRTHPPARSVRPSTRSRVTTTSSSSGCQATTPVALR